jgi:hypothetical protein
MSASMDPAGKSTIAHVDDWTYDGEYDKYASQESTTIHLTAGQKYYMEGIMKEGGGGDHISVAWVGPNMPVRQIIPNQYLLPLNPQPTRTPTVTPVPDCNSEVFSNPEALYLHDDAVPGGPSYMNAALINTSTNYNATIYRITGQWLNNGLVNNWATVNPDTTRPAKKLINYKWIGNTTTTFYTIPSGGLLLSNPTQTWDYTVNQVVAPNESGAIRLYVDTIWGKQTFNNSKLTEYFNYYHGNDFNMTVYYRVGTKDCPPKTITGEDGPTLNPARVNSGAKFSINANAAASANRSLEAVWFLVYNSSGTLVHYYKQTTTSGPYCLFGKSSGNCVYKEPFIDKWSEGSVITNDTYTVHVIARDKGVGNDNSTGKYSTHVIFTLNLNQATPTASNTPRPTNTPSKTPTPLPPTQTPTKTNTSPPTFTPTKSNTPLPPTATYTSTIGPSITPTRTPTLTPSPTKCKTPPELGGCK